MPKHTLAITAHRYLRHVSGILKSNTWRSLSGCVSAFSLNAVRLGSHTCTRTRKRDVISCKIACAVDAIVPTLNPLSLFHTAQFLICTYNSMMDAHALPLWAPSIYISNGALLCVCVYVYMSACTLLFSSLQLHILSYLFSLFATVFLLPPSDPFELTSFALALLLVFRTDSSYGRWNEAMGVWTEGVCVVR